MSAIFAAHSFSIPDLSHRLRRRVCAWLALALMAVNLVAGFGLQAAPPPVGLGDQVICTAGGIVVLHEDGENGTATASGDGFCLYCLPLFHSNGPVAQAFGTDGFRHAALASSMPIDVAPLRPARPRSVAVPRAPPQV
ncbi:MAG: hypothetical protein HQL42_09145 [Alphaproteobacteria bacterium]|nr:hypothetical protein [Alphaproteobacteria bacterium]